MYKYYLNIIYRENISSDKKIIKRIDFKNKEEGFSFLYYIKEFYNTDDDLNKELSFFNIPRNKIKSFVNNRQRVYNVISTKFSTKTLLVKIDDYLTIVNTETHNISRYNNIRQYKIKSAISI